MSSWVIITTPPIKVGVGHQDRHGIFCLDVEYHHIIINKL